MKLFYLICFLLIYQIAISQGAWNIAYLPIDSVSSNNIGLEIRIDFKSKKPAQYLNNIRSMLSTNDTGALSIDGVSYPFTEDWKIYDDHGVCSEQFLFSLKETSPKLNQYAGKSIIKEVTNDSIRLTVEIELRQIRKKKTLILKKRTEEIWIERNKLSGFLYKKE